MTKPRSVFRSTLVALAVLGAGSLLARADDSQSAAQAPALVVHMSGLGFRPATLTVHPGDRVTWLNDDLIVHTVTAADRSFDSGDVPGGKSWALIARKKGTFHYACRYHPNMTGTLIVQ
jgi:plastocyanin